MTSGQQKPLSREERLAAKLRENLRRRKTQARALENSGEMDADENGADSRNNSSEG
ncbi:hypothetical protein [Altericroceibacterium endophyticum]|uniref:hypothetical protein n=1 Tax=Altericroceibacterium endophyticum TaxID=1808508 RepID=UPI001928A2AA|nr:hypothetical protein [Altericroceibacterium endophyticum]